MTGAEKIFQTAAEAGVDICFANPGTTELGLVAALDAAKSIRPVLGLFEGVCTGAADGYGRIRQKPAMTLLHLGPGFANGIANLHNARRARTPILNIVGDHTGWIKPYDPPLNMDIVSLSGTVSGWQKENASAGQLSADTARAIAESLFGQIATLIVPADFQAAVVENEEIASVSFAFNPVENEMLPHAVSLIQEARKPALILGGRALRERGLSAAAQIKAKTGCELFMVTFPAFFDAGAGRPLMKRIAYFPEEAKKMLKDCDAFVLIGANEPAAFFGYADGTTALLPQKASRMRLDTARQDAAEVLEALSFVLGPDVSPTEIQPMLTRFSLPDLPQGPLNAPNLCAAIAALQPEDCIVVEEGISTGAFYYAYSPFIKPYSHLTLTGGSIGMGMPVALGAALAAPDRRVINIQADGSAMYTLQALWSQAREQTSVITILCSNRRYFTIELECLRAGYATLGDRARSLMMLDRPHLDWVSLSRGMGVPGISVNTSEGFVKAFQAALGESGPYLIEAVLG